MWSCGKLCDETSYEQVQKKYHGQLIFGWNPCKILKKNHGIVNILAFMWLEIVMDDRKLDEILLSKWQFLQHSNLQCSNVLQGMTNNVGFTFSVGTLHGWLTISIEQDK